MALAARRSGGRFARRRAGQQRRAERTAALVSCPDRRQGDGDRRFGKSGVNREVRRRQPRSNVDKHAVGCLKIRPFACLEHILGPSRACLPILRAVRISFAVKLPTQLEQTKTPAAAPLCPASSAGWLQGDGTGTGHPASLVSRSLQNRRLRGVYDKHAPAQRPRR